MREGKPPRGANQREHDERVSCTAYGASEGRERAPHRKQSLSGSMGDDISQAVSLRFDAGDDPRGRATVERDLIGADLALLHVVVTVQKRGDRARLALVVAHVAFDTIAHLPRARAREKIQRAAASLSAIGFGQGAFFPDWACVSGAP